MIDRRENGGLIGPYKTANINSANGMWSVYDQFMFKASNNWPGISILNGVQFIVIAGGGGGGSTHAGGGGAGGYRSAVVGESSGGGGANEGNLVAYLNNYTSYTGPTISNAVVISKFNVFKVWKV
jgi:hypothetical protein